VISESDQLHLYKMLGRITEAEQTGRDEPSWQQPPPCKRRKGETDVVSFLVDSDDEQDRVEPANGPATMPDDCIKAMQAELEAWPPATISWHRRGIARDFVMQKIPAIQVLVLFQTFDDL